MGTTPYLKVSDLDAALCTGCSCMEWEGPESKHAVTNPKTPLNQRPWSCTLNPTNTHPLEPRCAPDLHVDVVGLLVQGGQHARALRPGHALPGGQAAPEAGQLRQAQRVHGALRAAPEGQRKGNAMTIRLIALKAVELIKGQVK